MTLKGSMMNKLLKKLKISNNGTYLWHLCLDHINLNKIQRLVKEGPLSHLKVELLPTQPMNPV